MEEMNTSFTPYNDAQLDVDLAYSTITNENGELGGFLDPVLFAEAQNNQLLGDDDSPPNANRPYHAKRPHKKSRAGCTQCKKRKVKCDEARPTCKACSLRSEKCVYPSISASSTPPNSLVVRSRSASPKTPGAPEINPANVLISEPMFRPAQMADATEMKLLWFYTTKTFQSFSIESGRSHAVDHVLTVKIPEYAFQSPFLMDCLMALSSVHMQCLNQGVTPERSAAYRARAFEGYRNAIEAARPSDFPALLACSLLMCAVSSQMFREADTKPLYIIDWMQVWRGIGLIVDIISPMSIQESGLAVIFYRPPIDLEKSTQHIPNNLLFLITSIKHGDADYEHQKTYYDFLRYLGSLYLELKEHGFSPIMDLRIITFFTFAPRPFIPLARELRPRALIFLAYYLCFAKLTNSVWWMNGIADKEIDNICQQLGDEWAHLLRVPRMVMEATTKREIAKLIINNHNWTPGELNLYERMREHKSRMLAFYTDEGNEVEISDGHWRFKTPGIAWDRQTEASKDVPAAEPGSQSSKSFSDSQSMASSAPTTSSSKTSPPKSPSP